MDKFGGWVIAEKMDGMPQKVASAMGGGLKILGASYDFVAYLGHQAVNGTNHAVLATQTVMTGKDVKNAVVLIFNEKPESQEVALVGVRTLVENGGPLGGTDINMGFEIPDDPKAALETALAGFVGSNIKPVIYVGAKVTKGTDYIMIAEVAPVTLNPEKKLLLITVNTMTNKIDFEPVLDLNKEEQGKLGYAFTWL